MRRDDVEVTVLQREVVGDAAFVPNHAPLAFCDPHGADISRLSEQLALDKTEKEHFPHFEELRRDSDEAVLGHEGFYLASSLGLELTRAFLCANSYEIVLPDVFNQLISPLKD